MLLLSSSRITELQHGWVGRDLTALTAPPRVMGWMPPPDQNAHGLRSPNKHKALILQHHGKCCCAGAERHCHAPALSVGGQRLCAE